MQVMQARRIESGQRLGQKIGLLLVIALQTHPVTRLDHTVEQISNTFSRNQFAVERAAQR